MMKKITLFLLIISVSIIAQAQPRGGGWSKIFEDDFNGDTLNLNNWRYHYNWGRTHNHQGYSQDSNVVVSNGTLKLVCKPTPNNKALAWIKSSKGGTMPVNFTTGVITSNSKYNIEYGYIEIKVKMPQQKGVWPAFWMLSRTSGWPPEIDIMEYPWLLNQTTAPKQGFMNVHWGSAWNNKTASGGWFGNNIDNGFHVFAVDWSPTRMDFYLDNVLVKSHYTPTLVNGGIRFKDFYSDFKNMYMILNFGMGGDWPGVIWNNAGYVETTTEVDYVRVWQRSTPVEGGNYVLQDLSTGKVMEVTGESSADQAPTGLFNYNGGNHQLWTYNSIGDTYWKIKSKNSGKVLNVAGGSTADDAAIIQSTWSINAPSQLWKMKSHSQNPYLVENKNSNKVITTDGAAIVQQPQTLSNNQQWELIYCDGALVSDPIVVDGDYIITTKHAAKPIVTQNASTQNGAVIEIDSYDNGDHQKWRVIKSSQNGYYKLFNVQTGKLLSVKGMSVVDEAVIEQNEDVNNDSQLWTFVNVEDFYYKIENKLSGKVLSIAGASDLDHSAVVQKSYSGASNQRFSFTLVNRTGDAIKQFEETPQRNIAVLRYGNGTTTPGTNSVPMFIDEYDPNLPNQTTPVKTYALPTSTVFPNFRMVGASINEIEGALALSPDGKRLSFAGYDAAVGSSNVKASTVNRVIAFIDSTGTVNSATALTSTTGGAIKGAVMDGDKIWSVGDLDGLNYTTLDSGYVKTAVNISSTPMRHNLVTTFGGDLYTTTTVAGTTRVLKFPKMPTTPISPVQLDGIPATSTIPYGVVLFDMDKNIPGADLLYYVDFSGSPNNLIRKYSYDPILARWTGKGNTQLTGLTNGIPRGLTGRIEDGKPILYVNTETSIVKVVDNALLYRFFMQAAKTTLVNRPNANLASFKGIAFATGSAQTISFATLDTIFVDNGNVSLAATASSGLPVSYTSSNPNVATVINGILNIEGSGTTIITASQEGNVTYLPANPVSRQLTVIKKAQTITFDSIPNKTFGEADFQIFATASSGLPVTYHSSDSTVAFVEDGMVKIVSAGSITIWATQLGNEIYDAADTVSRILIIVPDLIPPTIPVNLVASATDSTVMLKWGKSSDNIGVTAYLIYKDGALVITQSATDSTAIITSLNAYTTYSFDIVAKDEAGNLSGKVTINIKTPDTQVPDVPQALTGYKTKGHKLQLNWLPSSDNVGVAGYILYRDGVKINQSLITTNAYETSYPKGNDVYSFTVKAVDIAGNISEASEVEIVTNRKSFGDFDEPETVIIFPNPSNGNFKVRVISAQDGDIIISVYNLNGNLIETVSDIKDGTYQKDFELKNLPSGMYLIKVSVNGFTKTKSFILK